MGILATPSRGQPLDVDYVAQIATQVNTLTTLVGDNSTSYSSINGVSVKTSEIKMFATSVNVTAATNSASGDFVDITLSYPTFKGAPVLTASVVSGTSSNIGDDATVVFKNISSQQAIMRVKYNYGGTLNVNVNVIAVGFAETA